jgi:hypothetical protein
MKQQPTPTRRDAVALQDDINSINAWANYVAAIPAGKLDPRSKEDRALQRAGTKALQMIQDWAEIEKRDGQHIVLQAPDGTHVLYSYEQEGEQFVERLTKL